MYEVKRLKERPVVENIAPAAVEERPVETPVDHSDNIDSLKQSMNELEEALRCSKHELKPVPAEESLPIDHNDNIDSMKKSIDELKKALCSLRCPNM